MMTYRQLVDRLLGDAGHVELALVQEHTGARMRLRLDRADLESPEALGAALRAQGCAPGPLNSATFHVALTAMCRLAEVSEATARAAA